MLSKPPQHSRRAAATARFGLLACFAALLALLAILGAAGIAGASAPDQAEPDLQLAEGDWEIEEEECVEAESEGEVEAACEEEAEEAESCPLRSAHAHLAERHGQLKLTIGYTTSEPTPAVVKVQTGGTKVFKRHLNRSGVLRLTESADADAQHHKVTIRIAAVGWAGCPPRRLVLLRH